MQHWSSLSIFNDIFSCNSNVSLYHTLHQVVEVLGCICKKYKAVKVTDGRVVRAGVSVT